MDMLSARLTLWRMRKVYLGYCLLIKFNILSLIIFAYKSIAVVNIAFKPTEDTR
jgi:hypothetical protein